ncbi:hypothetical protein [Micromonospora chersina]|uniref:hypothetical protein n=1 Tax=Micromonospora chersina TaxID=47854 RepID=UPI00370FE740
MSDVEGESTRGASGSGEAMMAAGPPDGWKVSTMLPARGRLQQYRLQAPVAFRCTRCERDKTSRLICLVNGSWSSLLCNGCHGHLLAKEAPSSASLAAKHSSSPDPVEAPESPTGVGEASPTPADGRGDGSPRARGEADQTAQIRGQGRGSSAEELRRNIARLAALLRARAEGDRLAREDQRALEALADENVMAVALRYAELLVEGDRLVAQVRGLRRVERESSRLAGILAEQRGDVLLRIDRGQERRLAAAHAAGTAPDYLDAMVMRHVGKKPFRRALAAAMKRRGLRPDGVDVPKDQLWAWLAGSRLDPAHAENALPAEVRRLRQLDERAFFQVLLADAHGTQPNGFLAHPAVVERWEAHASGVVALLREVRERTAEALTGRAIDSLNSRLGRLEADAKAYARAGARKVMATLALKDLRVRVVRFHRQMPMQRLRADCLQEAAAEVALADPELGALVALACEDHRARCSKVADPNPCANCAEEVANRVRQHRTRQRAEPSPEATLEAEVDRAIAELTQQVAVPVPTEPENPNAFVCSGARQRLAPETSSGLAVVETHAVPGTPQFGYAWVTEGGELHTGVGAAADPQEASVQAICRAALGLGENQPRVHLIARDARAVAFVQLVLRTGTVPPNPEFSLSDDTVGLLVELASYRQHISVYADLCPRPHRGAETAGHLAVLALSAGERRGGKGRLRVELDMIARNFGRGVGYKPTSPDEETDHAWWLPAEEVGPSRRNELAWRTALYRMHIDGGWCALPEPRTGESWQEGRLRLRIDHEERWRQSVGQVQEVTVRRRGGQWELGDVRWPRGLAPGVIVTFRWRSDTSMIKARTVLLPQPEQVDGVQFLHRYDAQVVTRESAPGFDQDREVPDLADASWVLRTLRKLGYLSVDGTATLAEDAIVRNCLALGLPRHRAGRIGTAVDQLLRSGRIQRVQGSLDVDGRPWYPPQPGRQRISLLRYVPRVEAVETQQAASAEWHPHRRGYKVPGHLRRLPPGAKASDERAEAFKEAVRSFQIVERELPDTHTYVGPHEKNR